MKRTLVIITVWLLVAGCRKHYPFNYIITGLKLYNANNSGRAPVDASTNDISAKVYGIRLEFTKELTNPEQYHNDESYYYPMNPVTSFTVTSLSDFDNAHPAGSALNNYFLYGNNTYIVSEKDSISYHINDKSIGSTYQWSYGLPDTWQSNDYLFLKQPPAYFGNRSFVIHLKFQDNTSITDTITVNLLP